MLFLWNNLVIIQVTCHLMEFSHVWIIEQFIWLELMVVDDHVVISLTIYLIIKIDKINILLEYDNIEQLLFLVYVCNLDD